MVPLSTFPCCVWREVRPGATSRAGEIGIHERGRVRALTGGGAPRCPCVQARGRGRIALRSLRAPLNLRSRLCCPRRGGVPVVRW
eukprot:1058384-Heterocapsa_arctica.AAC.1